MCRVATREGTVGHQAHEKTGGVPRGVGEEAPVQRGAATGQSGGRQGRPELPATQQLQGGGPGDRVQNRRHLVRGPGRDLHEGVLHDCRGGRQPEARHPLRVPRLRLRVQEPGQAADLRPGGVVPGIRQEGEGGEQEQSREGEEEVRHRLEDARGAAEGGRGRGGDGSLTDHVPH